MLLESFQNNKTPGNDGIPIEFYKKFWQLISEPFTKCANECFEKGAMSRSQKQAVITLIEKKGRKLAAYISRKWGRKNYVKVNSNHKLFIIIKPVLLRIAILVKPYDQFLI